MDKNMYINRSPYNPRYNCILLNRTEHEVLVSKESEWFYVAESGIICMMFKQLNNTPLFYLLGATAQLRGEIAAMPPKSVYALVHQLIS